MHLSFEKGLPNEIDPPHILKDKKKMMVDAILDSGKRSKVTDRTVR